ncbi:hypothetical protein, partial [Staphylococcus aureus]
LQAKMIDEDNPTFEQATNGPYREQFWEAMRLELNTLETMGVWNEVDREPWMNVLPGVWAYRVKRLPSGEIHKWK